MTRINTNVYSLLALHNLNQTNRQMQACLTRLSTGLRINSAADDPAGLVAGLRLQSSLAGLQAGISGATRAGHMLATADAGAGEISTLLADIREALTTAAGSGGLTDDERAANQETIDSDIVAIDRLVGTTKFNGRELLSGFFGFDLNSESLGSATTGYLDSLISGAENDLASGNFEAGAAILDRAAGQVAVARGSLGSQELQNYEAALGMMQTSLVSLAFASSAIWDTDYALEMARFNQLQILSRAGLCLQALANSRPQGVLDLLYG